MPEAKVHSTYEVKALDLSNLSLQDVKRLEEQALAELVERWGPDRIYEVKIDIHGAIHITSNEFMFFAWDSDEDWPNETWGTAKSNLENSFGKDSKFYGCDASFGHSREAEIKYFDGLVK